MTWGNPPKFKSEAPKQSKAVTPEQLASSGTEDGHQMAIFAWAASICGRYPQLKWLHAIPNGGSRNIAEATKMVAAGLRKGVPDIFLPDPYGLVGLPSYHGLYIELKIEKRRKEKNGGCSQEQLDYLDYLTSAGYCCKVCYGWIEARDVLINYLEGKL